MEQQSRGFFVEPTAFCNYTNVVMEHIVFEWDEHKAASNLRKHGVTFVDAVSVFRDPHCLVSQDRFENGEIRWQSIGYAGNTLLLLVAHTYQDRDGCTVIRIISARRASKAERRRYEHR